MGEGASRRGKEASGLLGQDAAASRHQVHPHEPPSLAEVIAKTVTRLPETCDIQPETLPDFTSLGCSVLQH